MGRLNDAVRATKYRKGMVCSIATLSKRLDADDLRDLNTLLLDETVPATVIASELGKIVGFDIGPQTMNRHRRSIQGKPGGCECRA